MTKGVHYFDSHAYRSEAWYRSGSRRMSLALGPVSRKGDPIAGEASPITCSIRQPSMEHMRSPRAARHRAAAVPGCAHTAMEECRRNNAETVPLHERA